ncbi:hypothetical protein [Streptomyces sp. NPDC098781]|uniref:hypothetical protein n=1 Tax=Streptomyces sp. NPDC098781 TaxID=3366097 RepID=UPI00381BF27A
MDLDDGEGPACRLTDWADGVLERLVAQDELDGDLRTALGLGPSLREETLARMAEAVRAAALGLGPAGCATAAGIPERLLRDWQAHNPSFAAAMAGASALARSHSPGGNGKPGALSPTALRVLLKAIRAGARHSPAAAVVGIPVRALNELRRKRPEVNALVLAARRARPKRGDRRGVTAYEHSYRLVRLDDATAAVLEPDAVESHLADSDTASNPHGASRAGEL